MKAQIIILLAVIGLTCSDAAEAPAWGVNLNIVELADRLGYYSYLLALNETGLLDTLRTANNVTLFIPTNAAFIDLKQATRDAWASDPAYYKKLMGYHIIQGAFKSDKLVDDAVYPTLVVDDDNTTTARVNIYTHGTKPVTQIVTYMGATVVATDYMATNGVIHVISQVVENIQNKTILQLVEGAADLSLFLNAAKSLNYTWIDTVLSGTAPVTLFAPSNDAINAFNQTLLEIIVNNKTLLNDTISAHVVPSRTYFANSFVTGDYLATRKANVSLTIHVGDNKVTVNGATVTEADNAALNGVVHVVSTLVWYPLV